MRVWQASLITGIAAAVLGMCGATALAQSSKTHVMTVTLPGGGVAQIEYAGNIAPQVRIDEAPTPVAAMVPLRFWFGADSPFARLDRIAAEMDREAAAMFQRTAQLAAAARSGQLTETTLQNLPPGSHSFSFVSTLSGNNFCSESVEITRSANGTPHVVRHSSGNCGARPGMSGSVDLPNAAPAAPSLGPVWTSAPATRMAPTPAARPDVVWTRAEGAKPYAGLVEPIPAAAR